MNKLLLVLVSLLSAPALGAPFLSTTNLQSHAADAGEIVRAQNFIVQKGALSANELSVKAFDLDLTFRREGVQANLWQGRDHDSAIKLVDVNGTLSGTMQVGRRLFELKAISVPLNLYRLVEVDTTKLPPHVDPLLVSRPRRLTQDVVAPDNQDVDFLYVYTPAARFAAGGKDAIEGKIRLAVANMNQAYVNSGIAMNARLVGMVEVSYTETGNMTDALNAITEKADGKMDNVHALRDSYGADMVQMLSEDHNYCGIAWVMNELGSWFEPYAFSVVYQGCLSSHTGSHEAGHNMGNMHDRANSSYAGAFPYSYGYNRPDKGWYDIMSYACPNLCTFRIPNFSNPHVLYNGDPTGIDYDTNPTQSADTARSMNNTRNTIAAFRPTAGTPPPVTTIPSAPTNLVATLQGTTATLTWSDNSGNEDGFKVDRADNGVWSSLATLSANTTTTLGGSLVNGHTYDYRVSAFNSAGPSAYSNIATIKYNLPTSAIQVTVTYDPAIPSSRGYTYRGLRFKWTGANGGTVTVARNTTIVAYTINDGDYIRSLSATEHGTYNYTICERTTNPRCSNPVSITY